MKKIKISIVTVLATLFFVSCKKEARIAPSFSVVGYWKGAFAAGSGIDLLMRPDGTTRLYIETAGADTAAGTKADGRYTVTDNILKCHYEDQGESADVQALLTSSGSMDGILFLGNSGLDTFQAIKQ
jgi:hypothetical protein